MAESTVIVYTVIEESLPVFKPANKNCAGIFPNPSAGIIYLRKPVNENTSRIEIQSKDGKIIHVHQMADGGIDITQLPSGIYTLTIWENDMPCTSQFIKK